MNTYRKKKGMPYSWSYKKRKEWGMKMKAGKARANRTRALESHILDTYGVNVS